MATKKKQVTYIGDAGVVQKKDVLGTVFIAVSNLVIAALLVLAVMAFLVIEGV